MKKYNSYTNHKILLGILLPILAFFISMNATFAYFSSSAKMEENVSQTGVIKIKITDETAWKVNSASISASTKLVPGDTLSVEGAVENEGTAQFYAILQLKINVTKSGETTANTVANKYYTYSGTTLKEIVVKGDGSVTSTAFVVDAPNANKTNTYTKTFSIPYTFDFYQFDNSYKNAKVNYSVYAHALQTKNLADTTSVTKMLMGEILPLEYQQVEYIQNTGLQYIDTGYIDVAETRVELDLEYTELYRGSTGIYYMGANAGNLLLINDSGYMGVAGGGAGNNITPVVNERYNVILNRDENNLRSGIINGVEIVGSMANSNVFNKFLLFSLGGAETSSKICCKLYSCKIYYKGEIVRDFVPCYRISDNEIGLYDKVNNVFYTNSGTGTFKTIPTEYQQVEYIESSGTQWIDTGYVPTSQNTKVVIDFQINEYVVQTSCFGDVFGLNTTSAPSFMFYQQVDNENVHLSIRNGDYAATSLFGGTLSRDCVFDKFHLEFSKTTKIFDSCGGTNSLTFANYDLSTNTKSIYLFEARTGDLYKNSGGIKIYSCKIYNQNNVIERDFVPCYRISDNEIGLYDKVNNVFYTNSGSGSFLKGANV